MGANFQYADLTGANLENITISYSTNICNNNTKFPKDSYWKCSTEGGLPHGGSSGNWQRVDISDGWSSPAEEQIKLCNFQLIRSRCADSKGIPIAANTDECNNCIRDNIGGIEMPYIKRDLDQVCPYEYLQDFCRIDP